MGRLLAFLIVGGVIMLAMYLGYKLFVAKENQHGLNRGLLLLIYLVSFCSYPIYAFFNNLAVKPAIENATYNIVEVESVAVEFGSRPVWSTILIWIFIVGACAVAVKTIITWLRIVNIVRSGDRVKKRDFTLVVIDDEKFAPFSWMRYVVINRNDFENENSAIFAHELKHIRSWHWLDLLIAQIVCVVNWFNPAAWLMRQELMLVHEYQADMWVIDTGHNPQEYQMLLIKKAVGSRFPSLANSINHSKLKKRITMMYKSRSGAGRKLKALALVPMAALALAVTNVPVVKSAVSTIGNSGVSLDKDSENSIDSPQYSVTTIKVKSDAPATGSSDTSASTAHENHGTVQYKVSSMRVKTDAPANGNSTVVSVKSDGSQADSPRFSIASLNNSGTETTVVLRGEGMGNNLTVSGGTFTNKGNVYRAKSLNSSMENGSVMITMVFPFSSNYEDAKVTVNINGNDVTLQLGEFIKNAQSQSVSVSPANGIVVSAGNTVLSTLGDVEIYLDDKKISEEEMKALSTDVVASIVIDKQNKRITITTK